MRPKTKSAGRVLVVTKHAGKTIRVQMVEAPRLERVRYPWEKRATYR